MVFKKEKQDVFIDLDIINLYILSKVTEGFPGGSECKEYVCYAGDAGLLPGSGRSPGGGHDNPLQCSCLENSHGQRSLVGYSPQHHKELDTTEAA